MKRTSTTPVFSYQVRPDDGRTRRMRGLGPEAKQATMRRLRRIEGQIRGLQRMVTEDRYCADVLVQLSSVHEALRGVGRELMRDHLRHCAARAVKGRAEETEAMYDELLDLMYKHAR